MTKAVYALMLSRFFTVYGEPKSDNPDAFISEYAKALGGFSDAVLEKAADRIMATHEYPTWPALGECVKAARAVASELSPPTPLPSDKPLPPRTPEEIKAANEIMARLKKSLADDHLLRPMTVSRDVFEERHAAGVGTTTRGDVRGANAS